MRESSKYLLGGLGVLIAQSLFIATFGWPQRMNHISPAAIGLFATAFVCIGYGAFLRWTEASSPAPASPYGRRAAPVASRRPTTGDRRTSPARLPIPVRTKTEDHGEKPWAEHIDWDRSKAFIIQNLRPDHLLSRLRERRVHWPEERYCQSGFGHMSNAKAEEIDIDDFVRRASEDPDIKLAVARVEEYGFEVLIGTYDEPSGRTLMVSVKQDEDAELKMRLGERLD